MNGFLALYGTVDPEFQNSEEERAAAQARVDGYCKNTVSFSHHENTTAEAARKADKEQYHDH